MPAPASADVRRPKYNVAATGCAPPHQPADVKLALAAEFCRAGITEVGVVRQTIILAGRPRWRVR